MKEALEYSCQICGKIYSDKEGINQFAGDTLHEEQYFPDNAFEIRYESEEKNFWFRVRNKIIGDAVTRYLSPQSRILEEGRGTGYVSRYMKKLGYHVECADLFFEALRFCKERGAGIVITSTTCQTGFLSKNLTVFVPLMSLNILKMMWLS